MYTKICRHPVISVQAILATSFVNWCIKCIILFSKLYGNYMTTVHLFLMCLGNNIYSKALHKCAHYTIHHILPIIHTCSSLLLHTFYLTGMTIEVFGTVLGTAIQGQIVGGAKINCLNYTSNDTQLRSQVNITTSMDATVSASSYLQYASKEMCFTVFYTHQSVSVCTHVIVSSLQKQAYMLASGVICMIYIFCAVILFLGVREHRGMAVISSVIYV